MGVPVVITTTHEKPADIPVRAWRAITRGAHQDQGEHWRQKMLPLHFRAGAATMYGYRRRTERYQQRKRAMAARGLVAASGKLPLVFSGNFRKAMLEHSTLRGFPTRVSITFNAPVYAPARQRTLRQPHISDEALRVTAAEKRTLTDVLAEAMERRIQTHRATPRKERIS